MAKKILIFVSMLLMTSLCWGLGVPVTFKHVIIVVEENHNYTSIVGDTTDMPYLNSLFQNGGLATQYYANAHPSLPNYFRMTSGLFITCVKPATGCDNYVPPTGGVDVDNVIREVLVLGKTWKSYAQSLPSIGYLGSSSGSYAKKHNPAAYYKDVVSGGATQLNRLVPFDDPNVGFAHDLAADTLPDYVFVIPDEAHDAHSGTLAVADQWLHDNIGPVFNSAAYLNGDTALIIVWDEAGADNTNGGGRVEWAIWSGKNKANFQSTYSFYSHDALCKVSLKMLGGAVFPNGCAAAHAMSEFFLGN